MQYTKLGLNFFFKEFFFVTKYTGLANAKWPNIEKQMWHVLICMWSLEVESGKVVICAEGGREGENPGANKSRRSRSSIKQGE